jgi:uncharacterized membrane protein (UPF0127 family)
MTARTGRATAMATTLAAVLATAACGSSSPALATISARGLPLGDVTVQRGSHVLLHLTVEIADTTATQQRGLMGVRHLAADQGEAFVFRSQTADGFWMKDTLIPLDIVFADVQGTVVDVQHMVPCTADPCPVYDAARFYAIAVETASGVLTDAGVRPGDTLRLARRSVAVSHPA